MLSNWELTLENSIFHIIGLFFVSGDVLNDLNPEHLEDILLLKHYFSIIH